MENSNLVKSWQETLSYESLKQLSWQQILSLVGKVEKDEEYLLLSWLKETKKTIPRDVIPWSGRSWEDTVEVTIYFVKATERMKAAQEQGKIELLVAWTQKQWEAETASELSFLAQRDAVNSRVALGESLTSLISIIPLVGVLLALIQPFLGVGAGARKLNKLDEIMKVQRKLIYKLEIQMAVLSGSRTPGDVLGHEHHFRDPSMYRLSHGAHRTAFVNASVGANILAGLLIPLMIVSQNIVIHGIYPWITALVVLLAEASIITVYYAYLRRTLPRAI